MKISIISTYFNSVTLGDFVHRSMNCLLNQTYKDIEFICINDGSKDDTLNQLKEYANLDNRIIILDKENEGVAQYAKAAGQEIASGEYIMLFDHDDLLSLDAIEQAVNELKLRPELDAITMLVKTQYLDGRVKYISNLDLLINNEFDYTFRTLTGTEMFEKTVGKYDVHFRGLIRQDKFKAVSFRYEEKLLNGDEIVERLIFKKLNRVGSCKGIYEHFIYDNSSAKSFNLKKIDIVRTDYILRKIFKDENVYKNRSFIFEQQAYINLINGIKAYVYYEKTLDDREKKIYINTLKQGYMSLDKKKILKKYSLGINFFHEMLLLDFKIFFSFYKIKLN